MSAIRVAPGRYLDPYTRLPVDGGPAPEPAPDAPAPVTRQRIRAMPSTGRIGLTPKGMLHRIQPDGALHPRCRGGYAVPFRELDEYDAMNLAAEAPWRLCRYNVPALPRDPYCDVCLVDVYRCETGASLGGGRCCSGCSHV